MAGSPRPGWYADPGDASRHRYWDGDQWTEKIRSAPADVAEEMFTPVQPRSLAWLWVGLGLIAVAALGVGAWLLFGPDSGAASARNDPSDVVVPPGWSLYTSETGVMSYAVDPGWTDSLFPTDQDFIHDLYSEIPGMKSEYSGSWVLEGSLWSGEGTFLMLVSLDNGANPGSMQIQARSLAVEDVDDITYSLDEEFTTASGYPGWRLDYVATYEGVQNWETVIAFREETTVVLLYGWSTGHLDPYIEDIVKVADSIVVHHPPTES